MESQEGAVARSSVRHGGDDLKIGYRHPAVLAHSHYPVEGGLVNEEHGDAEFGIALDVVDYPGESGLCKKDEKRRYDGSLIEACAYRKSDDTGGPESRGGFVNDNAEKRARFFEPLLSQITPFLMTTLA